MNAKMIYHDKKMIKHFFVILQQCNSASKRLWWNGSLGPKAAIGYDTKKNSYIEKEIKTEELHTPEKKWRKKNLESWA